MPYILFLAPRGVPGGITTWANTYMKRSAICFRFVNTARDYMDPHARQRVRRVVYGAWGALRRAGELYRLARAQRPDAVYMNCSPNMGLWLRDFPILWFLKRKCVPTIVHLHGGDSKVFFGTPGSPQRYLSRNILGRVDHLVTMTPQVENAAHAIAIGCTVHTIPNMLPTEFEAALLEPRAYESKARVAVLHVAGQSREKGTLDLLKVVRPLPQVDVRFVGPVPADMRAAIDEELSGWSSPSRVRFDGPLFGRNLYDAYVEADIFALPSHAEAFPMVVLEAMAHGLPIVATDVGAIADMLNANGSQPAGLVAALSDTEGFSRHLARTAASPDLRRQLGDAGRRRVTDSYVADIIVPQLDRLVLGATDGRRGQR